MSKIDKIISGFDRLSKITQLKDMVTEARISARLRCGSCHFWMKSRECPRERNVDGMSRGPSCEAPVCGTFLQTTSSLEIAARKKSEANNFAVRYDLPLPFPNAEAR